ncbi:M14 family zinc carboxypeptidase [Psychroflexus sp. ALD_RP9]|uniref:M14 family zinc carboxypeptidase n=1 Tax=Psychroflexus sp. ALD_RP9 TaxID=2777186 RepID=UPI001A8E364B|nr:M14 family zinc carboxypeptidase [Psychroflexus sp. ALD_RP9]QSS97022.1 peptidase M14 [Psychroflexus sp. ALD_RP9]
MIIPFHFYSNLLSNYEQFKCSQLFGRLLFEEKIHELNHELSHHLSIKNEGNSVESRIITSFNLGDGPIKILVWSQMHGNESTSTKAIYDFLSWVKLNLNTSNKVLVELLQQVTLKIIPILNPDGAFKYTRFNANNVDLNRDAKLQSQPETQVLFSIVESFQPHLCLNMHGQRTIFSAGLNPVPATLSFLSASSTKDRSVNETRLKSMAIINGVNDLLQNFLPEQVGRYNDAFNMNCTGDYLHSTGIPTVLFESGHFADDYEREIVRKYTFLSLFKALELGTAFIEKETHIEALDDYNKIPENQELFVDVVVEKIKVGDVLKTVGIKYEESFEGDDIGFNPIVVEIADKSTYYGHTIIDASQLSNHSKFNDLQVGDEFPELKINENVFVKKFKI